MEISTTISLPEKLRRDRATLHLVDRTPAVYAEMGLGLFRFNHDLYRCAECPGADE